ncbi:unnamed protein product [Adineta steineri]|uniref:Potassium channel domain-containing protein n=1 Tax=Adineta steineri TaxID=433720 RepID=A0A814BMJ3_9BILA|nr:unnamed protein product [Adineta steineri]CAF0865660.1 unnamed protein product [Adineta steineri]CAF0931406.1 unnamed protein product [Adineta steineri]
MILTPGSTASNRIQNYRTLAYVITTLVYLVIGAAIFDKLESTEESKTHANLTARIRLFEQKHNLSHEDFLNLSRTVHFRIQFRKKQWKFIGSFYYATVVLALIGYGHAIPNTSAGRAVTIAYGLIGIPMWLIMIQSVGERLNSLIKFVLKHIKRKFQRRKEPQITAMELLTCEALLTALTVATGSTTIGFGDLVPMQKHDYGSVDWLYILFCIMFILTGLTIVASSGNLLILRFVETNTKRSQHERFEMEERRRQQVRVIGDVISSNGRFITLDDEENTPPSLITPIGLQRITMGNSSSNLSLCSCRGPPSLSFCIPILCKKKFKRKQQPTLNNSKQPLIKSQMASRRTLRQEILDALQTKNEPDENMSLQRSYLYLDKMQQRNSI